MSNSANINLNMNMGGNLVSQFNQLSDKVLETEKSVKRLGSEFKNLAGTGIGSNAKLHSIVSGTDFKGGADGLLKAINKNKIKAYDGGILGKKELAGILDTRNTLKSAQLGARAGGFKDIEKMLKAPLERYETFLKAMDVSLTRDIKAMDLNDGDLKNTEKAIKKYVDSANSLILASEKSLNDMGKTATGAYKKANPSKTSTGTKIRGKDFSYDYDRYQNDAKYAKQVDELKLYYKRKADNYGQIGESAMQNAAFRGQKVFGSQSGQFSGFFQEIVQGFKNGINDGMKDFDLGELFSNTLKKGDKSRKQKKVLNNFGYDSDFITNTDAFMNTASFKKFAEEQKKKFSNIVNLSDKDVLRGMSKEDRARVLGDVRKNREIDFDKLSNKDRNKVFAGLVNNKGAKKVMGGLGMGGVFLTAATGVTKLTEAAVKLGTEAVKAYEGVQQLQTQLGVVFGTKVQSSSMFSQIEDYAKKSPFGVEGMVQNAVLLKQSGVYGSELMDTMKRLGDISSGNNEKMKSVSEVYARVMSSQTVTARDMRQLTNAGVPAYSALADATGIDRGQIRNKLQSGQIKATDFEAMLKKLTDKGGMFYGATATGAQTLAAKKQNLSDARQMMMASFGERLARFGGATTQDSFYGKTLDFLQGIFNGIEEGNKIANRKADEAAPEMIQKKIEELEKKRDKAKNGKQRQEIDDEINMYKAALKPAEQQAVASGEEDWKDAQEKIKYFMEVLDSAGQGEISKAFHSTQEITDTLKYLRYLRNGEVNFDGTTYTRSDFTEEGGSTLLEGKKDRWEEFNAIMESLTGKKSQAVSFGEGNDEALGKALNKSKLQFDATYLEVLSSQASNELYHFYSEVAKATEEGNTWLNKAIENTVDTFDKFETVNVGPGSKNNYGAQHLMNSADEYYRENSSVYKMHWKDQKAYYDEMAKQEILDYDKKSKTGKKDAEGNDIYSFAKMTAEQMQRAQELLTTNAEKIMSQGTKYDFLDDKDMVTEEGSEKIRKLRDNFSELLEVAENTGGEGVFGDDFMKDMKELTKLLTNPNFGDAAQNIATINDMISHIAKSGGSLAAKREAIVQQISHGGSPEQIESLQNQLKAIDAMAKNRTAAVEDRTYSAKKAEKINERLAPSLRAQVLSQVTGVSAERVANSKESSVMNAYLNNFSQRQTFAQLGKVLMQNGAELKDVARAMQEGKNGQKYGMYDWNKSTSSIEEQAAQKNVATQEALISAYQQQIDALQELTVGSIATRDQWDNLGSLSAQLGVAFELSAKTLADGTVQFTDATIQSAHKMMEELNLKKFNQQMSTILNSTIDKIRGEQRDTGFKSMVISGSIPSIGRVKTADVESYAGVMSAQAKEISKTDKTTLVNSILEKARSVYDSKKEATATAEIFTKALGDEAKKIAVKENVRAAYSGGPASFSSVDKLVKERMDADFKKTKRSPEQFQEWAKQPVNWGGTDQSLYYKYYALALRDSGYKNWPTINVERNFTPGNTSTSGTNFRLASVNGQKESAYIKESMSEKLDKGYGLEGFSKKDAEDLVDKILSALDAGNLPKEYEGLFLVLTGLQDGAEGLKTVIEDNTQAQIKNAAMQEVFAHNEKLLEFLGSKGVLGEDAKTLENSKAFSEMNPNNPLLHKINSPFQDALLEFNGVDKNVDYKTYRRRRVGDMMKLDNDTNGNGLLDENETANKLKDDEKTHAAMRNYLTSGTGKRFAKELYKNAPDEMKKELGSNFGEFQEKLKGMDDKELDGLLSHFEGGEEPFEGMKTGLDEVVAKMQEAEEHSAMFQDSLTQLGNSIKNEALSGAMNAINTGFTKAGDLAYKLQNNLIEGADATMEMKKALAGVAATMLENIGASMTKTGLDIAGAAAQDRNWGMVAAGLALAVAGGAASFGGGMLSAFASDNNKGDSSEAEDQLARLEDLKDNLAELLKQAKDDAIYYETNLRQKQAVAFNDAVSSTSVNDAIITPSGVVNTAPDDYIMAMKDPTQLMGKGGGGTNVSFSIVNESGTPMTVTSSETREGSGGTEIVAFVNAIVQKSMNDGEYDDVMAGMQVRQRGSQISS